MTDPLHVVVDGANVVGSRPDGWWHDRAGAARRLAEQLVSALAEDPAGLIERSSASPPAGTPVQVHLVLEGAAKRVTGLPSHPQLSIVNAPSDGDSAIAALVDDLAAGSDGDIVVVTADRGLRERVVAAGARTVGPSALRRGR